MDDDIQHIPRKRRRPALSCEQCRGRKVRCDRKLPCGPCQKALPSLRCSYVHEGKNFQENKALGNDNNDNVFQSSDAPSSPFHAETAPVNTVRLAQVEQSVRMLQSKVQDLEHRIPADNDSDDNQVLNILGHRVNELQRQPLSSGLPQSQILTPPLAPYLKSMGKKTELVGATSWAHVFEQLRPLREFRRNPVHPDDDIGDVLGARSMRSVIKHWQTPRLLDPAPDLLNDVPARELCDQLIKCYLRTIEPIFRVLHIPSWYGDYEKFWEQPQSASTGFLLKLLMVLGIGSIFYFKPGPSDYLHLPIRRWIYAAQWWLTGPASTEARNLVALQVFCLLLVCRHVHAIDTQGTWNLAGSLFRLALGQGLHRDPKHLSLSPFEGEMRRRIWATVVELNLQLSIDAAMPPLLAPHDFDTEPPSNLNDEDFGESSEHLPPPRPREQYTTSVLQLALLHSFPTRVQISQISNECNREQSYEAALECGTALCTAAKELAVLFQGFLAQMAGSGSGPTLFHYQVLDILLHRALLHLYRPFALRSLNNPLLYLSRKLSLESALAIASYAEKPDSFESTHQQAKQDFYRLCVCGGGFFEGSLSYDVIVVIGLELNTQIEGTALQPTGSNREVLSAINQVVQDAQAPLLRTLERIQDILYQGLPRGMPCMKRYCLVGGILAEVQAAHLGESQKQAKVEEALLENMRTCRFFLDQFIASETNEPGIDGLSQGFSEPEFDPFNL